MQARRPSAIDQLEINIRFRRRRGGGVLTTLTSTFPELDAETGPERKNGWARHRYTVAQDNSQLLWLVHPWEKFPCARL